MKIKITKHGIMMSIIYIMFGIMFFSGFLRDCGLPSAIIYSLDLLNVLLLTIAVCWKYKQKKINNILIIIYSVIVIIGLLSFLLYNRSLSNIILFFFDCRSLIRCTIFFMSCNLICTEKDVKNIFKFILTFHVINMPYIVYQYFTLEVDPLLPRGDYLNGFFGAMRGPNAYVNVLFILVIIISCDYWKKKEMSLKLFVFFFLSCLFLSALIELKIFFVEIFMILFLSIDFSKIKITPKMIRNAFIIIIGLILIMYATIQILYQLYPSFANIFSLENLMASAFSEDGYTGSGDFNRLTAVFSSFETFFDYDIIKGLFGIGMGTTSDVAGLSEFAKKYEYTHYSWFTSSYIFTQVGFIGLFLYISTFFIMIILRNKKSRYSEISRITALMSVFLIIYGEALRTDIAYMLYFVIASGYAKKNLEVEEYGKKILSYSSRL